MALFLILLPLMTGSIIFLFKGARHLRNSLLLVTALLHAILTAWCWVELPGPLWKGFLLLDETGLLFLSIVSLLFLAASIYGIGYLSRSEDPNHKREPGVDAGFCTCLLLFLSSMTLVMFCQNMELLWVAIEATTLTSAPLIYFYRTQHSLEATWKYFMICSVGIALALLGNFFIAVSTLNSGGVPSMLLHDLLSRASLLNVPWLKAGFLLLLVGYGTKMGLAPLHTWLPDAHSESPAFISALLSGALLNCAFLGILRAYQICLAANLTAFAQTQLQIFGFLSMAFAAAFIVKQADYKRMLAYSSVEHMGILALSIGFGGTAIFGGMLHALNHSLIKASLFLVAGNILIAYKSRLTKVVAGVGQILPISGGLWVVGFLAITGMPPFGIFVSKFVILKEVFDQGHTILGALCLFFLTVIFVGMTVIVLRMFLGEPTVAKKMYDRAISVHTSEAAWSIIPPLGLMLLTLILGLYLPSFLANHLRAIALSLGGQ